MSEQSAAPARCGVCCDIMKWTGALVLIIVGTGMLAEWQAWAGYKKYFGNEYTVKIVLEDGSLLPVDEQSYAKVYRNEKRVDIISNDKNTKQFHFTPTAVLIERKKK
jgi:hypothetical protein